VASLSQGRTAAAQCGLFTYKSVPVIFEPPCIIEEACLNYCRATRPLLDSKIILTAVKCLTAWAYDRA